MENNNPYQDPSLLQETESNQAKTNQATSEVAADSHSSNGANTNQTVSANGVDGDAQAGMVLSPYGMMKLSKTASWAKFLSIVGFVSICLLFLLGIFMLVIGMTSYDYYETNRNIGIGLVYLVGSAIGVVAYIALFLFAKKAKRACKTADSDELEGSLENLCFLYQYTGILTIIYIAIIVIALVVSLVCAMIAN